MALEASTVPPEGATEAELEQQRIAKIVDGLIDRKVLSSNGEPCRRAFCVDDLLVEVTPRVVCVCQIAEYGDKQ